MRVRIGTLLSGLASNGIASAKFPCFPRSGEHSVRPAARRAKLRRHLLIRGRAARQKRPRRGVGAGRRSHGFGASSRSARAARRNEAAKASSSAGGRSETAAKRRPPRSIGARQNPSRVSTARLDRAAGGRNRHFAQGDLVLAALIDEGRDGRLRRPRRCARRPAEIRPPSDRPRSSRRRSCRPATA